MNPQHPGVMPPQRNTLSLEVAKQRMANWVKKLERLFPTDLKSAPGPEPQQMPKGVFFAFEDIKQIVDDYKPLGYDISGVRVYFCFPTDDDSDYKVRGIIVPTMKSPDGTKDLDLIMRVPTINQEGDPDENDSIYDFSKPCPTYCSFESPIHKK